MLGGVERAAAREALRLGNRVAMLARLGGIALLVAVLGATTAVMSMLRAIGALERPAVADFVQGLAPAFTCLALGLLVALVCYVAFFWLDASLTRRVLGVRDTAEELMRETIERASSRAS
jgi:biopolymer transport protein ExbB/TolQ